MNDASLLQNKVALVTGGTSGIGYHTALALARLGPEVYITGRNPSRGRNAQVEMRKAAGHRKVHFISADTCTVGGNRELARQVGEKTDQLHILVNNMDSLYNDPWVTADLYEATLAMNFVGPHALTEALLPLLRQSAPARIVNVTSAGYTMWKGDVFEDIQSRNSFSGVEAYNRSKYLNLLWTLALARRLEDSGIVANALHPGTNRTNMTKSNEPRRLLAGMQVLCPIFGVLQHSSSPTKVAQTLVYLASAPEAAGFNGRYFENNTRPKDLGADVTDAIKQEKAWELGEYLVQTAMTVIHFGPELIA